MMRRQEQRRIWISQGASRIFCLLLLSLNINFLSGCFSSVWSAAACQVKAAVLSFGMYDILSVEDTEATAGFTISCNSVRAPDSVPVQVLLSAGGSGNSSQRFMLGSVSGAVLYYNLYLNAARSTVFGDGSDGSGTLTNSVNKSTPWTVTVYGRIPALQNVPIGTYTDSLTITILY